MDKTPAYPAVIHALKREAVLPQRVYLRQCKFLNNVIEQDHRIVKKRTWLAKGYGGFHSAWRTLEGIETMHMIRKGRVRWVGPGVVIGRSAIHFQTLRSHRLMSLLIAISSPDFYLNQTSQQNRCWCADSSNQ
jgi:DDE domain